MLNASRLTVLMVAVLAACGESPSVVAPSAAAPPAAATTVGVTSTDNAIAQALVDALNAGWNTKNPAAYAAPFSEDVEFISPVGTFLSGRAAIEAQHAFLFSGPFAPTTQLLSVRRVDFLTGTIAVVDVDASLTGFVGLPPGLRATEPGLVLSRVRWVIEKRGGVWEIVAQQMTPVPPAA